MWLQEKINKSVIFKIKRKNLQKKVTINIKFICSQIHSPLLGDKVDYMSQGIVVPARRSLCNLTDRYENLCHSQPYPPPPTEPPPRPLPVRDYELGLGSQDAVWSLDGETINTFPHQLLQRTQQQHDHYTFTGNNSIQNTVTLSIKRSFQIPRSKKTSSFEDSERSKHLTLPWRLGLVKFSPKAHFCRFFEPISV